MKSITNTEVRMEKLHKLSSIITTLDENNIVVLTSDNFKMYIENPF